MFFKGIALLLLLLGLPAAAQEGPSDRQFLISPDTCVAINKGRTCYTQVSIEWQLPEHGDYCLFLEGQGTPLACWKNRRSGQWQFEFASATSIQVLLKRQDTIMLSKEIQVNWVYESQRRKRNWRLF
ncbi:DUF3019 domain-containing protein [Bowmanella denitrificans]|nr:DUF3019 domain-containing protein [Bowmanella denitrificans]